MKMIQLAVHTLHPVAQIAARDRISGPNFKLNDHDRACLERAFAGPHLDAIIKEVELMADTAWAYHAGSSRIADCDIELINTGLMTLVVKKVAVERTAITTEVESVQAAQALLRQQRGLPVGHQQAGKRIRLHRNGHLIRCGTAAGFGFSDEQIAASTPIEALMMSNNSQAVLGVVIAE